MQIDGRCLCGHVRYEAEAEPERTAICHCTDCQMHSASAYGVVVGIDAASFKLTAGSLKTWVKTAESGAKRALTFGPECGTRIYGGPHPAGTDGFFSLRTGTIRQREHFVPRNQVWTRSRQAWTIDLSTVREHEQQYLP